MSCENPSFVIGSNLTTYGTPNPRQFTPLVRINAMVQDMPEGYTIKFCHIPIDDIKKATNQTLSQQGNTITLSDGGGSVTIPSGFTVGTAPTPVTDPVIPTSVVGQDTYLLGEPAAFLEIDVGGTKYLVPAYGA